MRTEGTWVIDFIESCCVHALGPLAGQALLLESWQKDFLLEAFRYDKNLDYIYRNIVFSGPRGVAKSTLAAAVCLSRLHPQNGIPTPQIVAAANTALQAQIVWGHAKRMVESSYELSQVFETSQTRIWCPDNAGKFTRISAEGKAQFGLQPTFVEKDEISGWITAGQLELEEALQTSLVKTRNSQALSVSTAGWNKNTLFGRLFDEAMRLPDITKDGGLTVAKDESAGFLFWNYAAPDGSDPHDPKNWRLANPGSWTTDEQIAAALNDPSVDIDSFKRQNLNQWTAAHSAWFAIGKWESLRSDVEIPEGARIQVAVDASRSNDSTAVAWAYAPSEATDPVVVRARVWSAIEKEDYHVFCKEGFIDLHLIQDFITNDLGKRYKITEISYDPRFFDQAANELRNLHYSVVPIYPGTVPMDDAYQHFFTAVTSGLLTHDEDKIVAAHVNATSGTKTERGWKVHKLKNGKIDACIALCMAHARALNDAAKRKRGASAYIVI